MNRKLKFALGAGVIVCAVAALIYTAVRETSAYFLTMDEYAASAEAHAGKPLRLAGRVSDGSVDWDPKTLDLAFLLKAIPPKEGTDLPMGAQPVSVEADVKPLPVRYNGILPDMFAEGRDVIVEGKVTDGTFHADALLTTCPSKYEADVTDPDAGKAPHDRVVSN